MDDLDVVSARLQPHVVVINIERCGRDIVARDPVERACLELTRGDRLNQLIGAQDIRRRRQHELATCAADADVARSMDQNRQPIAKTLCRVNRWRYCDDPDGAPSGQRPPLHRVTEACVRRRIPVNEDQFRRELERFGLMQKRIDADL